MNHFPLFADLKGRIAAWTGEAAKGGKVGVVKGESAIAGQFSTGQRQTKTLQVQRVQLKRHVGPCHRHLLFRIKHVEKRFGLASDGDLQCGRITRQDGSRIKQVPDHVIDRKIDNVDA